MEMPEDPYHILLNETFMWSLEDGYLLSVIRVIDDVNVANHNGDTILHFAVRRKSMAVPLELIERGADINANGERGLTPLHLAVHYCNVEAVCLFLYYNVDVTVVCEDNKVAFMDAVDPERLEIAYLLLDYHDEFPVSISRNETALYIFARNLNPIAIDLVHKGVNVNCLNDAEFSVIPFAIRYNTSHLFKLLWGKIDKSILFLPEMSLLGHYLAQCKFSHDDWVECLYLILECDQALEFVQCAINFVELVHDESIFIALFTSLNENGIALDHSRNIIYTFLTLGAEVSFSDIDWLVGHHVLDEILWLSYFSIGNPNYPSGYHVLSKFFTLTCHAGSYTYYNIIVGIIRQVFNSDDRNFWPISFEHSLRYFTLPSFIKHLLVTRITSSHRYFTEFVVRKIMSMPDVPSLTEICRNKIRILIKKTCKVTKPYQFYDALKKLQLSELAHDVLSFRLPLYK